MLTTMEHLSANVASDHRIEVQSIGVRSNPWLRNVHGLRMVVNISGELVVYMHTRLETLLPHIVVINGHVSFNLLVYPFQDW